MTSAGLFVFAMLVAGCPGMTAPDTIDPCDKPGIVCTTAGTGLSAFDGDGRAATKTSIYFPLDVDFDASGRPLILDWNNLRIRRIEADDTIKTIMGVGFEAVPLEGALAKDTALHHASEIAVDSTGRMYLAGDHVPLVFRVDLDDRVRILAGSGEFGNDGSGGPARSANLTAPYGVLPLDDGSFYFSDIDADVIRFVDTAGTIHTIAGNGLHGFEGDNGPALTARLKRPARLARDARGDIYFCDSENHVIRRLTPDLQSPTSFSFTITTFAGTGELGYSGDGGPATAASFNTPYGLCFSPSGDLFVADTGNNVIRRVDQSGTITTAVGTGAADYDGEHGAVHTCQLNAPSSVIFASDGSMWISDTYNQRVRRVGSALSLFEQ